jgi:hypothetical protein
MDYSGTPAFSVVPVSEMQLSSSVQAYEAHQRDSLYFQVILVTQEGDVTEVGLFPTLSAVLRDAANYMDSKPGVTWEVQV